MAERRVHLKVRLMPVQYVFDDCQTETRAADIPALRGVDAIKALRKTRQMLRRDAGTVVDNLYNELFIVGVRRRNQTA